MRRIHLNPPENVTVGEWRYLLDRYAPEDAEERRERIVTTLKRLARRGINATQLHNALMLGTRLWEEHTDRQTARATIRRWNARIRRAQKDVDRALASLRQLIPRDYLYDDDVLFANRDLVLTPKTVPPPTRPKGGRPSEWKREAEEALRQAGVGPSDRRELLAALGFVAEDETPLPR